MKAAPDILIIEDDPWFAEQQVRTLTEAGFTVRHAPDGIAGIDALDEKLPDVLVLDMFLPGPNALVLLHEIQSHADLSQLPVIVCSGSAPDFPHDRIAAYGVASVLDKGTMQPSDLIAGIKRVLP